MSDALARYEAATEEWRRCNAATQAATLQRAYAIADLVAAIPPGRDPIRAVARQTGLSPASVERLLAKARQALETEGEGL